MPDLDDPAQLKALVAAINRLRAEGRLLAYHDRSDGGLWATVCEMAFAGHLGVSLNVDLLVTEGDGIGDSRAEYGDSKNWAAQVERAARRADAEGAVQRRARRRDPGARRRARDEVMQTLRAARPEPAQPRHRQARTTRGVVEVWRDAKAVFSAPLRDLHQVWDEVSWRIARLRDNPACADAEHAAAGRADDPGLHLHLSFDARDDVAAPFAQPARGRRSRSCASRASTATSR